MNFESAKRPVVDDRPIDALLAGYAARTLAAPLQAMIAAHLAMLPDNRAYVAALEAAHGLFLSGLDPVPLTGRDRRLVNIFASAPADPGPCVTGAEDRHRIAADMLPAALRDWLGRDLGNLIFHPVMAGVERAVVGTGPYGEACVLQCRPEVRFREHGHSGLEAVLVLSGSVSDQYGTYGRGQLAVADETRRHQPTVGSDGLVCFMVSRDQPPARSRVSRLISQMLGG